MLIETEVKQTGSKPRAWVANLEASGKRHLMACGKEQTMFTLAMEGEEVAKSCKHFRHLRGSVHAT